MLSAMYLLTRVNIIPTFKCTVTPPNFFFRIYYVQLFHSFFNCTYKTSGLCLWTLKLQKLTFTLCHSYSEHVYTKSVKLLRHGGETR